MAIDIIKPKLIPVATTLAGTEFDIIYNPTTERIERILVSNSENFISINGDVFRLIKSYTGSVKNIGVSIEINDIIKDGVIRNNGVNILILNAKYTGGDITDFGTYDAVNSEFVGGNYIVTEYNEL